MSIINYKNKNDRVNVVNMEYQFFN